jgi:hypothetical protein
VRISRESQVHYCPTEPDIDRELFLSVFDEPPGSKVLVVGAHDDFADRMLAESDFDVTAIDLRQQDRPFQAPNYRYIRTDFCTWVPDKTFDVFVALSALEHFGLTTYDEGRLHRYYDVVAMRKAWECLRERGKAYVSVPVGGVYVELPGEWRVYDLESIQSRLQQDFDFISILAQVAGPIVLTNGEVKNLGDPCEIETIRRNCYGSPHITGLIVMEKVPMKRLAPDGR